MPAPFDGLTGAIFTQTQIDTQYLRSVNSFWCPVCQSGFQRPDLDANEDKTYDDWLYHCDHCQSAGTRDEIKNSSFYAMRIRRHCLIDDGQILPAADQMQSNWWMNRSATWQWRCNVCGFVGTLAEFQQAAEPVESMWGSELCLPE